MRIVREKIIYVVTCLFLGAHLSWAGEKEWLALTDKAIENYRVGNYNMAVAQARLALKEGEATYGADDLKIVGSIDDLATYLVAIGQKSEAEALYQRALAILEKRLPSGDSYLAIFMTYLASCYDKLGKPKEAERLRQRASAVRRERSRQHAADKTAY
jgi:tetratricopeptide (TPR) repeat protein